MDIGVAEIDEWHRAKGWNGCGYQYVIKRDGTIEDGRGRDEQGAHVAGYNAVSLGICMVGGVKESDGKTPEDNYTDAQWDSLDGLVGRMVRCYGGAVVQGHRDFPDVAKACPCFDAIAWAESKGYPVRKKPQEEMTV